MNTNAVLLELAPERCAPAKAGARKGSSTARLLVKGVLLAVLTWTLVPDSSLSPSGPPLWAQSPNPTALESARSAFAQEDYDTAIEHLRLHLRSNLSDDAAWNLLGAAYYHTGLPLLALKHLDRIEDRTREKSYNYYYQGLCYLLLRNKKMATHFFQAASTFNDDYGSRGLFELGLLLYHRAFRWDHPTEVARAREILDQYLVRFPQGSYAPIARRLVASLTTGIKLEEEVLGTERPDMDRALYRYNPYSLGDFPNFWQLGLGLNLRQRSGQQPDRVRGLKPYSEQRQAIDTQAVVGFGPLRQGASTAWGGYFYGQQWFTDAERITSFFADPTFETQPFQTDLLERRHHVFGDYRYQLSSRVQVGLFGRLSWGRVGSQYLVNYQNVEIQHVLPTSDISVGIPWLGVLIGETGHALVYGYFRKEISTAVPEFSHRSYDFEGDRLRYSLGLSGGASFESIHLDVAGDLFRYQYTFNLPWFDYTRTGGIVSADLEFYPRFHIFLYYGLYRDAYDLETLKLRSCTAIVDRDATPLADAPLACRREDSGDLVHGGIYWNISQFSRLGIGALFVTNANAVQREYEEQTTSFVFRWTMAFPSVNRVERFVQRFGDFAFTKEAP